MTEDLLNGKTHLIFDDVVAIPFADKIQTDLTHPYFPWYLSRTLLTVKPHEVEKAKEDFDKIQEYLAFIHVFFDNSNGNTVSNSPSGWIAEDLFRALLAKLNLDSGEILRCKANFQTQHRNKLPDTFNTPHVDHTIPHYTAIYYVNDSDGDTRLFDKTEEIARISPKKGRIIVFDGQTLHAGSHPYENDYRIVINYNFRL